MQVSHVLMNSNGIENAFLYKDVDLSSSIHHKICTGAVAVFSSRSPVKTSPNEDAAAIIPVDNNTAVLVVADGVGGSPAGAQASAYLVDAIHAACTKSLNEQIELRYALLSGIETANRDIIAHTNGSATTLAAVEIQGESIRTYHIGDSMILLVGMMGKTIMETISHSPTGYAVESGILSENDAIRHESRHLVSNVVGSREMHISMGMPIQMKKYDTLLLATDGLFDNIEKETIINIIRRGSLVECSQQLASMATARMTDSKNPYKPDDLTFILYRRSA